MGRQTGAIDAPNSSEDTTMTTLSDLTLAQLTAIYSAVSGKTVGMKFFNSKATGVRRVEALLAEGNAP